MKKAIFMAALLMLAAGLDGALSYVQEFHEDGSSRIARLSALSARGIAQGSQAQEDIALICEEQPELGCSVDRGSGDISIILELEPEDGGYRFQASYGFPSIEYSVAITRIPSDLFEERLERILEESGRGQGDGAIHASIDLLSDNSAIASLLEGSELDGGFEAVLPDGSRSSMPLSEALARRGPIEAGSSALNLPAFALICGIIAFLLLLRSFLSHKREIYNE